MKPLVTGGRLKIGAARLLTSAPIGWAVGTALSHQIPNRGLTFDTADRAFTRAVEAELLFRLYEDAEIRFARKHLAGADFVIDLGSSLGIVASHALSVMASNGRMICVEANPRLLGSLRRTIEDHASGRRVDIVHAAVAYGADTARLTVNNVSTASKLSDSEGDGVVEVPSLTLTEILERCAVNQPYAMVSDIEGAEGLLLREDSAALGRCHLLLAELHTSVVNGSKATIEKSYRGLLSLGFKVLDQHGPVFVFSR